MKLCMFSGEDANTPTESVFELPERVAAAQFFDEEATKTHNIIEEELKVSFYPP